MNSLTEAVLKWHEKYGRQNLPWQSEKNAYRVWLSEIMLQQTQVQTVIPYYQRFVNEFPDVNSLAKAHEDRVLHLWTGLGYYARARNLHKAAKIICAEFNGKFPTQFEDILSLPGIGRSTAGAILAFTQNRPFPILDGNVKRVLTRFYAIEGWPAQKRIENKLWELATHNTPQKRAATYTQAIMDFGATVCTRSNPKCETCVLAKNCQAKIQDKVSAFPFAKPKKTKPIRIAYIALIENESKEILLRKNPPSGIWGGLWCPPQFDQRKAKYTLPPYEIKTIGAKPEFRHTFSHYQLDIKPLICQITAINGVAESQEVWYKPNSNQELGLAAPIKKLLEQET